MAKLAINRLRDRGPLDDARIDRFLQRHPVPIVEGVKCTFLFRGSAHDAVDEVWVCHRIVGQPDRVPMKRIPNSTLWFTIFELPAGSRVEYQIEVRRGEQYERFNDPLNPKLAHSPVGSSSVCQASGYTEPEWARYDPEARPGELLEMSLPSGALRRESHCRVYLPARYRATHRYPLLVVHDGDDFLNFAAMKNVLDNLIHRRDMAETIVAFTNPGDRTREYANSAQHARFLVAELIPRLEADLPLLETPAGRALMGASFGAIASLSTAYRYPDHFGSLLLQSGSFVFTDIGDDHGGGPAFDPVVRFMNRYRRNPTRVVDRMYVSCGIYEPLIVPNRSMVNVFRGTGMEVRYSEARDGHSWEDWRDRLREGLSWLFPGEQQYYYE
ncbi:alpha/beta hydrolase-fold protein [Calidifontibacter terrae]